MFEYVFVKYYIFIGVFLLVYGNELYWWIREKLEI